VLIDCDTCVGRGTECGGCVLSVMLEAPPEGVELDADERHALAVLADGGLLPPLRLVPGAAPPSSAPSRRQRAG
jgi:hypothetical protein